MDTSEFSEAAQAEGTSGEYWQPQQALRLECLRLAIGDPTTPAGATVDKAKAFYDFVQGMVDIKPAAN